MPRRVPNHAHYEAEKKKAKKAFLRKLEDTGNVTLAAKHANVSRRNLFSWRDEDPTFAYKWDQAEELGIKALEDEVIRRGFQGVNKPVYQGGELVGHVRQYSDLLAMFVLKAKRPHVYRENYVTPEAGYDGEDPKELLRRKLGELASRQREAELPSLPQPPGSKPSSV